MNDPVKTHESHGKKLDEIFGKIKSFFKPKPSVDPKTFLDAMRRYQDTDTDDKNCQGLDTGKKLNRVASGTPGTSEVKIGINTIKNIKGLRFELIDGNNKGTNKFNNAIVDDFRCYDTINDPYGIAWLFARDAEYMAEYISGNLKYLGKNTGKTRKNQNVNFVGNWMKGMFHGNFMGGEWGGEANFSKQAKFMTQPRPSKTKNTPSKGKGKKAAPKQAVQPSQKKITIQGTQGSVTGTNAGQAQNQGNKPGTSSPAINIP